MKRKTIFSFVLIALLLIGIGYATISDTLKVNGSNQTTPAEIDLIFTKVDSQNLEYGNDDTQNTVAQVFYAAEADDLAEVKVTGLTNKGDKATLFIQIQNISEVDDLIAVLVNPIVSDETNAELFKVTTSVVSDSGDANLEQFETGILTITVELLQSASRVENASFKVTLHGYYQMNKGQVAPGPLPAGPAA